MTEANEGSYRVQKVASVLRPFGRGPSSREQAVLAGHLLGVHWTTGVSVAQEIPGRLCRKLRRTVSSRPVAPYRRGPSPGGGRLEDDVDKVIDEVLRVWLPKQRQLAHPGTDLVLEVRRSWAHAGL